MHAVRWECIPRILILLIEHAALRHLHQTLNSPDIHLLAPRGPRRYCSVTPAVSHPQTLRPSDSMAHRPNGQVVTQAEPMCWVSVRRKLGNCMNDGLPSPLVRVPLTMYSTVGR
jgi:hypothetical protein